MFNVENNNDLCNSEYPFKNYSIIYTYTQIYRNNLDRSNKAHMEDRTPLLTDIQGAWVAYPSFSITLQKITVNLFRNFVFIVLFKSTTIISLKTS